MVEVLRFIFSDFWIWLGAVLLVMAASSGVAKIILACRGKLDYHPDSSEEKTL